MKKIIRHDVGDGGAELWLLLQLLLTIDDIHTHSCQGFSNVKGCLSRGDGQAHILVRNTLIGHSDGTAPCTSYK